MIIFSWFSLLLIYWLLTTNRQNHFLFNFVLIFSIVIYSQLFKLYSTPDHLQEFICTINTFSLYVIDFIISFFYYSQSFSISFTSSFLSIDILCQSFVWKLLYKLVVISSFHILCTAIIITRHQGSRISETSFRTSSAMFIPTE